MVRSQVKRFAVGAMATALTAALGVTVTPAPAHAATYKWVSNYAYSHQSDRYRAWLGAYIATNDARTVNNVIYCKFVTQRRNSDGDWVNLAWADYGYNIHEIDVYPNPDVYHFIVETVSYPAPAVVQVAANTWGNYPSSHGVGCHFQIFSGSGIEVEGAVWDGPT